MLSLQAGWELPKDKLGARGWLYTTVKKQLRTAGGATPLTPGRFPQTARPQTEELCKQWHRQALAPCLTRSKGWRRPTGGEAFCPCGRPPGQEHQVHAREGDLGEPSPLSLPGLVFQK